MAQNNIPALRLADVRITCGVVLSHDDPENRGRVKAYVPGLFTDKTMDIDAMPWVWPFAMGGFQTFSLQNQTSKIWVIILPDNPFGYFYLPFFELSSVSKSYISGDTDILLSRSGASGPVSVYYNNDDGIKASIGASKFQISQNLDTTMDSNSSRVSIEGGHVTVGKQGDGGEPMVLGQKMKDLLCNLSSGLNNVAQKMSSNPYVNAIGAELANAVTQLNDDISTIQSETCSVTE